jgi:hypothetical protein
LPVASAMRRWNIRIGSQRLFARPMLVLHLLQRLFDCRQMRFLRGFCRQRRAFALDHPTGTQQLERSRGRLNFVCAAGDAAAVEYIDPRSDAYFDQAFDFQRNQRFAHRRPRDTELARQVARRRQARTWREHARADQRTDLVGDLTLEPAWFDTLIGIDSAGAARWDFIAIGFLATR